MYLGIIFLLPQWSMEIQSSSVISTSQGTMVMNSRIVSKNPFGNVGASQVMDVTLCPEMDASVVNASTFFGIHIDSISLDMSFVPISQVLSGNLTSPCKNHGAEPVINIPRLG